MHASDTDTHVTEGWQVTVVIWQWKYVAGRKDKGGEGDNVLAVYSAVKKGGRRLDRVYFSIVIMCTIANAIPNHY